MLAFKRRDPNYLRRMWISLFCVLMIVSFLVALFPRQIGLETVLLREDQIPLIAEAIDLVTSSLPSGGVTGTPEMVTQPVPSPDAAPDATVPETVDISEGVGAGEGIGYGMGGGTLHNAPADTLPPRPLLQVMAEYPKEERKRKVRGIIRLQILVNELGRIDQVRVLTNETGSVRCEAAASEAARLSLFQPAMAGKKPIKCWTICEFGFEPE